MYDCVYIVLYLYVCVYMCKNMLIALLHVCVCMCTRVCILEALWRYCGRRQKTRSRQAEFKDRRKTETSSEKQLGSQD